MNSLPVLKKSLTFQPDNLNKNESLGDDLRRRVQCLTTYRARSRGAEPTRKVFGADG